MKKLIYLVLLSLFIFSCSPDDGMPNENFDYIIFGHFYGFCLGETCIETFKLDSEQLYEDIEDNYSGGPFNFKILDHTKFEIAKDIINFLPAKLLSETNATLGCPDCTDGGGFFIEYSKNGKVKSWKIDRIKNNVPSYLHDFMDKVNDKIKLINK